MDFDAFTRAVSRRNALGIAGAALALKLAPVAAQETGVQSDKRRRPGEGVDTRVYNGDPIPEGKYRFLAAMQNSDGFTFCTASLIGTNKVLTAAHCIFGDVASKRVAFGSPDLAEAETVPVVDAVRHPLYRSRGPFSHDVAVVTVEGYPFQEADTVRLVEADAARPYRDGAPQRIMGFGEKEDGSYPTVAEEAVVKVWSDERTAAAYNDPDFVPNLMYGANETEPRRDTCAGDSGGPAIFVNGLGEYVQAGVTSWGEGCALPKRPGIYAQLSNKAIRQFIRDKAGV